MIFDHDGTLMIFDDAIGDREAQTCSCSNLFCREEWIKDTLFEIRGNTRTSITHTQYYALCLHSTGDGNNFMCHVGKRITRIGQEINNNLFQLDRVANHQHLFFRKMQLRLRQIEVLLHFPEEEVLVIALPITSTSSSGKCNSTSIWRRRSCIFLKKRCW